MTQRLRIAIFVGTFPVISETFVLRQITGLLDLGHEVTIYADSRPDSDSPMQPEVATYRLLERATYMDMPPETAPWEMPVWPLTGRTWPPGAPASIHNVRRLARAFPKFLGCVARSPRLAFQVLKPGHYRYQARSLSALHRLAALSRVRRKYDVLHAHFGPVGNSFRFARDLWKAPLVVSFHGYDFSTMPRKDGADIYDKLFATADAFTVNSDYTQRQVEKLRCPKDRIHKLTVGLDPHEFPFRERTVAAGETIRLLTVARLTEIKGHEYVLRAVARLAKEHPALHYDVAGDGPLRRRLEELVGELGIQHRVTFHGPCDSAVVKRLMAQAHLFVLASVNVQGDQEGQGLVLQEAQACGLPAIATDHGALPEGMIVGQSGFLIPERNVDALTERLSYLIEHPETWPEMGRKGREFVEERFDIRKLNHQLIDLFARTIKNYHQQAH